MGLFTKAVWILLFPLALSASWVPPFGVYFKEGQFPMEQFPRIARDPKGNAVAAWVMHRKGIEAATFSSSHKEWSPIALIGSGMELYSSPLVILDLNGRATAVWVAFDEAHNAFLQAAHQETSETWSKPISLSLQTDTPDQLMVDATGDESGNLLAAWIVNGAPACMWAAVLPAAASYWGSPILLAKDFSHRLTQPPAVALARDKALVAWKINTPSLQLQTKRFSFRKRSWSSVEDPLFFSPSTQDIENWSVALDPLGNAVAVLNLVQEERKEIAATLLPFTRPFWGKPVALTSKESLSPQLPFVTIDSKGNAIIFWTEREEKTDHPQLVFSCSSYKGERFSPIAQDVPHTPQTIFYPIQASFDRDLNGVALWGTSLLHSSIEQSMHTLHKPSQETP